ncbi:peptidylprolyl isomerase [Lentibacillus saliphilus]|uniref:peptidylprolyl isomerase n=1 Tax=Lentibacillus saliphilus TaxID=2737028 RepID=UPI001C303B5E
MEGKICINRKDNLKLNVKKWLVFITGILLVILAACGDTEENSDQNDDQDGNKVSHDLPTATIQMKDGGQIKIELYPDVAPNTVANFVSLAEDGFYDGLIFHRVIPGFMIQGGDPKGNGTGGPGYTIKGEFSSNDFKNDLAHDRGVVSMARAGHPDSAGSQFFIVVKDASHLDGDYATFGKVIDGMESVDEVVSVDRDQTDKPLEDQVIESITVDRNGHDIPEPDTL